ncbi:MAG TPA: protein kinase [Gammaproteobacteria bacterium]|nr:protein kinase [Gammaproteobacteria bacterium]
MRFGPYEIAETIGSGGMGEVYRARDIELGRDVAIKVLPASVSTDAMLVARFEQEAKTLAALNHPNIAHIYGLARSDGTTGIVMELVGGATALERLAEGPLPVQEALSVAVQIADALVAAHERGIVHRDLKPANIKLRSDGAAKVLDFGIAKALDPRLLPGPGAAAVTAPAETQAGTVLGTAAYMSPEQAKGNPVDRRTDIWAFGCVLYEMLTGKAAFAGEDLASTLARVLEAHPDLSALPSGVSPAVRRTLELCFEKDAGKRIADMRDVKLALAGKFATGAVERTVRQRALPIAAAVAAAALLAGAASWLLKPAAPAERRPVTRLSYTLPSTIGFGPPVASLLDIAPAGDFFAFNGADGLYVRRMEDAEARRVPGTDGGLEVVISPDGRELAYVRVAPELVKTSINGGAPVVLAKLNSFPTGVSWEPDGTLFYGQPDGIWRVSQDGGTPEHVVKIDNGALAYGPQLLPGGEWVLFTLATGPNRWNEADIVVQSLRSGERRKLRSGGFDARYLPSGQITYVFQNTLFASAFDVKTLKLDDERVSLVDGIQTATTGGGGGSAFYAVSSNGTLIFVPQAVAAPWPRKRLVWVDRAGNAAPLPAPPDNYTLARISPDGARIALVVGSSLPPSDPPGHLYVFDLKTENLTQLTSNRRPDDGPVWSRDGKRIFYRGYPEDGSGGGSGAVYAISADGGMRELLATSDQSATPLPWSISPDGNTLLLVDAVSISDINVGSLAITKENKVQPLLDLDEQITEASLAPNGQWLLYGRFPDVSSSDLQVDIRPFPDVKQQRRSVGPGTNPVFSADGSEIFVFDGAGLSAAPVQYSPVRVGDPKKLFRGEYWYGVGGANGSLGRAWDVDPKNDRFLMITLPEKGSGDDAEARSEIDVVVNWSEELREKLRVHRDTR